MSIFDANGRSILTMQVRFREAVVNADSVLSEVATEEGVAVVGVYVA